MSCHAMSCEKKAKRSENSCKTRDSSKAGYSAKPEACAWAGAVKQKLPRKRRPTDQPTDQPPDQLTNNQPTDKPTN